MILNFDDLFITNNDGTFAYRYPTVIGGSTIHAMTFQNFNIATFGVNLANCQTCSFDVSIINGNHIINRIF